MGRLAWVAVAFVACVGFTKPAQAQAGKLGAYTGTVTISGMEIDKNSRTNFSGKLKVSIPVESIKEGSLRAEAEDTDKPSAMATITHWDLEANSGSPGADGKITSWKCSLDAPVDVPMNAQGALDVDASTKKYSMYFALIATKRVAVKCVNSRSGPYKDTLLMGFFFGTSEPELLPANAQPYSDPARLAAKYKLVPAASMKGSYGPLDQEWDLRLQK